MKRQLSGPGAVLMAVTIGASAFAGARPAAGADWQPAASLRLLGGQYMFRGTRGSVSGNAELNAAIAAVFNDRWSLLGSLDSDYEGTKPLSQPVGGGSLFQQRTTHAAGLKAVYKPESLRWRFKPSLRYRLELLRETKDETWFHGLFDSRTMTVGFEGELPYRDLYSLRLGVDYLFVSFPNYGSLESRVSTDFNGGSLSRELAGEKTLNHESQTFYGEISAPVPWLPEGSAQAELSFERRGFGEQPVVSGDGSLTDTDRVDFVTRGSGRVGFARELRREIRLRSSLSLSGAATISNQNRYDASQGIYLGRYYNGVEFSLSPSAAIEWGDDRLPAITSLSVRWTRRSWGSRPAQDASGRYGSAGLRQTLWKLRLGFSYPLGTRLRFLAELETVSASSNQQFEQYYRYNYGAMSLLTGLTLDF
jgi:hypothetical protein